MDLKFSPKQQSAISFSLTLLAVAGSSYIFLHMLRMAGAFFSHFSGVLLPFFTAAVFAVILRPYHQFWMERARCGPGLALGAVYLSVFVPMVVLLWIVGGIVLDQLGDLVVKLPTLAQELREKIEIHTPALREMLERYHVADRARAMFQENMNNLATTAQNLFKSVLTQGTNAVQSITGLLGWAVMPVYLGYLLLMRPRRMVRPESLLPFLKERTRKDVVYLGEEFMHILVSFFRGQFVVAALQGLVYGSLYAAAGLKMGFVIGLLQGLLNVVPFVGTIAGITVAIPVTLLQDGGGPAMLGWWAVAFAVGQIVESYVITPRIMGERTGLHPMAILFAIFFWGTALQGVVGIFLAIPLTAFFVVVWRLLKTKYMTEIV
jgi:predicted PurR-regulated permease PerM